MVPSWKSAGLKGRGKQNRQNLISHGKEKFFKAHGVKVKKLNFRMVFILNVQRNSILIWILMTDPGLLSYTKQLDVLKNLTIPYVVCFIYTVVYNPATIPHLSK